MPCAFKEASMEVILSHEAESIGRLFNEVARIGDSFEATPNKTSMQDQNIQKLNKAATVEEPQQVKRPNIFAQKTRSTISTISRKSSNIFIKKRNVPLR